MILEQLALHYDRVVDYWADKSVAVGEMKIIFQYCKALRYSGESNAVIMLCWWKGKFPQFVPPADPIAHWFLE